MTTGLLTTTLGQAAIVADLGGGADLVLTHVAFGDANGVPYNPNVAQTQLVNERYRSTIASVAVVAGAIVIDAVIPADTPDGSARPSHGFNVAEAGLFSSAGTLIAVARMGNGYKPPPSSGQASIATFRFKLAVANPSAIAVVIDPQAQIIIGRQARPFWIAVDGVQNAPPPAPALGATYVIGSAPTGAWTGFASRLAQWVGVWSLAEAPVGHVVSDNSKAENSSVRYLRRTAAGWASAAASQDAYGVTLFASPAEVLARAILDKAVSPGTLGPLLTQMGVPANVYVRTESGIYTKPPNLLFLYCRQLGAGGSGGSSTTTTFGGGGGNGGFAEFCLRPTDIAATVNYTVGTGGAVVAQNLNSAGWPGGNSSFPTVAGDIVTGGGQGGGTGTNGGPVGTGGPCSLPAGTRGFAVNGSHGFPGANYNGIVTPTPLGLFGRGGSGGVNTAASVGGGSGLLVIEEYLS